MASGFPPPIPHSGWHLAPGWPASSPVREASWTFSEEYVPEDEVFAGPAREPRRSAASRSARRRRRAPRFIAALADATVVEVGTGTGVSGVWILARHGRRRGPHHRGRRGRAPASGSRDVPRGGDRPEPGSAHHGRALEVLPRLTDGVYDLVLIDGDKQEYADLFAEALRLLRPGGVVAFDNALWHDRVADPSQRDPDTVAIREMGELVRESEDSSVLLPLATACSSPASASRREAGADQAKVSQPAQQEAYAVPGCALGELVASPSERPVAAMSRCAHARAPANSRRNSAAVMVPAPNWRAHRDVGQVGHQRLERRPVVLDERHPPDPLPDPVAARSSPAAEPFVVGEERGVAAAQGDAHRAGQRGDVHHGVRRSARRRTPARRRAPTAPRRRC